jgi:thiopurine S-methyltransferase
MEPEFWQERWNQNQIGFHLSEVNSKLQRHWPLLEQQKGSTVFVPLCGKSKDLFWLNEQGHRVLGVELSSIAIQSFFKEHDLPVEIEQEPSFTRYSSGAIELLEGDLFDLTHQHLENTSAVFDRGALVALPPGMRERYVEHLLNALPAAVKILLVTVEYDQAVSSGPPFSVPEKTVSQLFAERFQVSTLERKEAIDSAPHLKERGLTSLVESVYLLQPKQ